MSIFLTGDTHGDFTRFKKGAFPVLDGLNKEDYVIICGDFGGLWLGDEEERHWLNWLDAKPFTTLFVDGNHENYDLLRAFPLADWHGGQVQAVRPSVLHLMRGQLYEICGKTFFTMGGAASHDMPGGVLDPDGPDFRRKRRQLERSGILYRVKGRTWWKEELPSPEELESARETLERAGWSVDYIVTHCCPAPIQRALAGDKYPQDILTGFLEEVRQKCRFQNWFFGHYHANKVIAKKFVLLYQEVISVT